VQFDNSDTFEAWRFEVWKVRWTRRLLFLLTHLGSLLVIEDFSVI